MENTFFPHYMLEKVSDHYQAHLERISDYLLCGPGIWWKEKPDGILFLDGCSENDCQADGPILQHFRSMSSAGLDLHLNQQWEACLSSGMYLQTLLNLSVTHIMMVLTAMILQSQIVLPQLLFC